MQAAHMSPSSSEQRSALQAPNPYILMRAPQREEDLTMTSFRWLASLPSEFRPIETGRRYARIVSIGSRPSGRTRY